MSKPVIIYERIAILNAVEAIPDKRFKSGYRSREVIATSQYSFQPEIDGTVLYLDHLRKQGKKFNKIVAHCEVSMTMQSMEQEL